MLEAIFIISLFAFYVTRLIRILPFFKTLYNKKIKPISCDVCMSFWVSLLGLGIYMLCPDGWKWVIALPGACLFFLSFTPDGGMFDGFGDK
jgi:hypothetical protein